MCAKPRAAPPPKARPTFNLRGAGAGAATAGGSAGAGATSADGGGAGSATSGAPDTAGGGGGDAGAVCSEALDGIAGLDAGTVWQPESSALIKMIEKRTRMRSTKDQARHFSGAALGSATATTEARD